MPNIQINKNETNNQDRLAFMVPVGLQNDVKTIQAIYGDSKHSHTIAKLLKAGIKVFKERGASGMTEFINNSASL